VHPPADKARSTGLGSLFLNVFALAGAALGVANVVLAWRVFGTGGAGDQWMLALTAAQAFVVLSQMGVEQVAVFSASARARGADEGARFDRDSLTWGLISGLLFAMAVWLALPVVVQAFAHGFGADARQALSATLLPLLMQVALSPALYVLRQQLLLRQRAGWSVLLGHTFSGIQCLALFAALAGASARPEHLALVVGAGSASVVLAAVLVLGAPGAGRQWPQWTLLLAFIRASVALRLTHSAHNFLVVLITNAALSSGSSGTLALFQYVKRVADGLCTVSVGPHLGVYHAAQAIAWARRDRSAFAANLRAYLRSALPLLALAAGLLLAGAWLFRARLADSPASDAAALGVFGLLLAWQALIAVETVPAGVLALDNRAGPMLLVNGVYIGAFFLGVQWLAGSAGTGTTVAALSLACQVLSLLLFSWIGWRMFRRHFGAPGDA
jgi:hypothetical protein